MKRIVDFLYEIGSMRKIARSHRQALLTDDLSDNIAAHSYRVAMIGYFLAKQEKADAAKVMLMCLLHDTGEARSGDQNWINKRYVKVFEDEIIQDQLQDILPDNEPYLIAQEYQARHSLESKIAKDADVLDQFLILQEYILAGNNEAKRWLSPKKKSMLHTDSAKALFDHILTTSPNHWWNDIWTPKRREV